MRKLQTLLVDDEPIARRGIRLHLEAHTDFEVVAECKNGKEAVTAIKGLKPDLVFLDILMPELGGFDVIRSVGSNHMPAVIFITAYDQHAIRAFEVNAVDYLLKPVEGRRFDQAIQRARTRIVDSDKHLGERLESLLVEMGKKPKHVERFVVKQKGRIIFVDTADVDWIEAAGNYISLHVGMNTHMVPGSMNSVEARLDPESFRRVHRSIIVNTRRIRELHPLFHGEYQIVLAGGTRLTSGRRYCDNLKEYVRNDF
jgi:two-component system LytT family response regulator